LSLKFDCIIYLFVMEDTRINEDSLREAAAIGDLDKVKALIRQSVDVNSRNSVNGWYAVSVWLWLHVVNPT